MRVKGASGAITNKDYGEIYRHGSIGAGLMVTPFGQAMPNFKTGLSPIFVIDNTEMNGEYGGVVWKYRYFYGIELPFRFRIVEKSKWFLEIGCDIIYGKYTTWKSWSLYTSSSMMSYGIKF